ncbi:MAG: site-specific tyrosine recombinase XerD [Clostridium argentinense]|uniref:Site-specific tyrosine recombinase XerD n=1 Tax=Clostridium faecium TaxID=2762223 RepID=A0ABR8YVY9_9CLOT|nr:MULTISPECIES: site-specific tyrosine recombinase XerD [Clostridium]MBD8048421.1 site-specific tyrosine recombinase XerD [Clostridium faecium]MBS5825290.1 site-specific tyrosine recombinase XerD [Clostridium argentinense]MDU1350910.1 site-specific tyrosine recombinase XerD [Clostridium argentinense]
MNELLKKYIEHLQFKNLSYNTIDAYKRDLTNFIDFLKSRNEELDTISTDAIILYAQKLKKEGKANTSITRNIISIRNFYKYLIINKIVDEDPTLAYELPKNKKEIPKILTIEEVDKFLLQPDLSTIKGIRDKAMLEVMYATGVKVSELLGLTIYDINLKLFYIKIKSKDGSERIIPLGRTACKYLKKYLEVRDEFNKYNLDLLFLNVKGNKMSRQGFWKIIKHYSKEANINKYINSYTLRHSFAVHLLQNGADIKSVQELLGHNNMSATQIYSFISRKNKIEEVYRKSHPRA